MRGTVIMAAVAAALLLVSVSCNGPALYSTERPLAVDRLSGAIADATELPLPDGVSRDTWEMLRDELANALLQRSQGIRRAPSMLFPPTDLTEYHGVLSWSQNLTGDYDNNGEVNVADLTPLAVKFGHQVQPTDPPDCFSRRIDGDGNGEINLSDVTPIAVHFSETITGYRVLFTPATTTVAWEIDVVEPPTYQSGTETSSPVYYFQAPEQGYYAVSPRGIGQSTASRTEFVFAEAFDPGVDPDPDPNPDPDPDPGPDPDPDPDPDPGPDPDPDPDPDPEEQTGIISGRVRNTLGGPVSSATVIIPGIGPILTNEDGYFVATHIVEDIRTPVQSRAAGFAEGNAVIEVLGDRERFVDVTMKQVAVTQEILADDGGSVTDGAGASVQLGPQAVVDASNNPVTGNVYVSLTPVDLQDEMQLEAAPSSYYTVDDSGEDNILQSYGMLEVSITDDLGYDLQFADGETIEVEIPVSVPPGESSPESSGFFLYDAENGEWVEVGTAELSDDGTRFNATFTNDGRLADVSNLRWYNIDVWLLRGVESDATAIGVTALDPFGEPIQESEIFARGCDYQGLSSAVTDSSGYAELIVRKDSNVDLLLSAYGETFMLESNIHTPASPIYNMNNYAVQALYGPFELRRIAEMTLSLTWGEQPQNLDSHLLIPYGTGTDGGTIHLSPGNPASLDAAFATHDANSFGPEKINLWNLKDGIFEFIVENVDGWDTFPFEQSAAQVLLSATGLDSVIVDIPVDNPEQWDYWHVFTFRVYDHKITEVIIRNDYLRLLPPAW